MCTGSSGVLNVNELLVNVSFLFLDDVSFWTAHSTPAHKTFDLILTSKSTFTLSHVVAQSV